MLVFPKPDHPILREAIHLVTKLVISWDDAIYLNATINAHEKAVCLTGPVPFSVAIDNIYNSYGSWAKLNATLFGTGKCCIQNDERRQ
jgi:hypothetical protein